MVVMQGSSAEKVGLNEDRHWADSAEGEALGAMMPITCETLRIVFLSFGH